MKDYQLIGLMILATTAIFLGIVNGLFVAITSPSNGTLHWEGQVTGASIIISILSAFWIVSNYKKTSNRLIKILVWSLYFSVIWMPALIVVMHEHRAYLDNLEYQKSRYLAKVEFEKNNQTVTVISPNGGEVWERGKTYDFKYKVSGDLNNKEIIFNLDNLDAGARYAATESKKDLKENEGSISWKVNLPPGRYKAVILDVKSGEFDLSDNYFTITD